MTSQTWTYPASGGRSYTTGYTYDSAGCLRRVTYPTGTVLTMVCDTANRVTNIQAGNSPVATVVGYHPSGQPNWVQYGNGVTTSYAYDDRARMTGSSAPRVNGLQVSYDGADNVKSLKDGLDPRFDRTMQYDGLDRVTSSSAPGRWGTVTYDYDALGNRSTKLGAAVFSSYSYDSSTNRLDGVSGNEPFKAMTFAWDDAGRLASSSDGTSSTSYTYDGFDRRVQKADPTSLTTVYHHDAAGKVIAETLPDGTKLRDYVYLGSRLLVVDGCMDAGAYSACGSRQWYHTDALGSPLARTDLWGNVAARLDYQAWGEVWTQSGVPGDRQYNGRVYDPGTGFHDYGARLYWPQVGRFVSADTVMGSPTSPMTLNRYSYVLNNPYKYVDPTGQVVVFAAGVSQPFKAQFAAAVQYMNAKGIAGPLAALNAAKSVYEVRPSTAGHFYDPNTRAIEFDPGHGIKVPGGGVQTPAMSLLHEVGHALQHETNPSKFAKDVGDTATYPTSQYANAEEARNVNQVETPAATKAGEPTRTGQVSPVGGAYVPVSCSTCTK